MRDLQFTIYTLVLRKRMISPNFNSRVWRISAAFGLSAVFVVIVDRLGPMRVQAQPQPALVIEGGTLLDGNGGVPVPNSAIVIVGDRISQVGKKGIAYPANAKIINAAGKFVVPGLIDAKSNYASNFGEAYLIWGVTSGVVSSGAGDAGTGERDAINHGVLAGPRLFVSVASVAGPGPDGKKPDNGPPQRSNYVARTPEDARRLSKLFLEAGADILYPADGDGPPELFKPLVEEAHKAGKAAVMRTIGPGTGGLDAALMDSDVLVHSGNLGNSLAKDPQKWKNYNQLPPDPYSDMDESKIPEVIKILLDHHVALEPDLMATGRGFSKSWSRVQQEDAHFFTDPALLAYYPEVQIKGLLENAKSPDTYLTPAQLEVRARGFKNQMLFLHRFIEAGGRVLPASDIPQTPPGFGLHQELAVFQEDVGMTPAQVLQAATKWQAEAFKLHDLGVIEPGKLADIDVVNADPLQTVLNLRKIDTVIKDGKIVDRTYHASYLSASLHAGMNKGGSCCFSSPAVEGLAWTAALKQVTWRPDALNGGFNNAGGIDSSSSPTPGIESIFPYSLVQGAPTTTLTLKGFNFVRGSKVFIDNQPVPVKVVSRTELEATLDANLLGRAGRYPVVVKNPLPIATVDWGDTSNQANLLVLYKFTLQYSHNKF